MYPHRDFRFCIEQPGEQPNLWRTMIREPLQELLQYWNRSGRPKEKYSAYSRGLAEGCLKERWPYNQLDLVYPYPEFHKPLLESLETLWKGLSFDLGQTEGEHSLYVDYNPEEISTVPSVWSEEQKLLVLRLIQDKFSIRLTIDDQDQIVGVFLSKRAREIYQHITCLRTSLENYKGIPKQR